MLISIREQSKIYGIHPTGVVHVGGHLGEEFSEYKNHEWGNVIWVEAQPKLAKHLEKLIIGSGDRVINAAVWNSSGVKLNLHITSNSESSSLLDFGTHSLEHPEIVVTSELEVITETLDGIVPKDGQFDYLALDIQGVELRALQGFEAGLGRINWICTEVNNKEVYKGCAQITELDKFLSAYDFKRCATRMTSFGWGDAIYIRSSHIQRMTLKKRLVQIPYLANFAWLQFKSVAKQLIRKVFLRSP
jgi:FkbM family methyltransferase